MKIKMLGVALYIVAVVWASSPAAACVCKPLNSPCEAYADAELVFVGQVVDESHTLSMALFRATLVPLARVVRFRIEEQFKGISVEEVSLLAESTVAADSCSMRFGISSKFLVYAYRVGESDLLAAYACTRTQELHGSKQQPELELLREYAKKDPGGSVEGYLSSDVMDTLGLHGTRASSPVPDGVVTLQPDAPDAPATTVRTMEDGSFELGDVRPGRYTLSVMAEGFRVRNSSRRIRKSNGKCVQEVFVVEPDR